MAQTIRKYVTTITVTNGVGTKIVTGDEFRPSSDAGGILRQILVKAPKISDTFHFDIIDSDIYNILDIDGSKGKINNITQIPIKGNITLSIDSATTDGIYNVKIILMEIW